MASEALQTPTLAGVWRGPVRLWMAVFALLAAYAIMSFTAAREKGLSFDEGLQLAAGYNIWRHADFRSEGANGDLVKRWATLPYLVSQPRFVGKDDPLWQQSRAYDLGWRFFFELGNRPDALLREARGMIVVLGVATGLLVFWCSRQLFGPLAALLSLAVFTFSPEMLAFGGVVSTDMSISLTLLAATWCIWRLLHEITPFRLLVSLAWTGLLVLAKTTALVILPITAVLLAVRLGAGADVPLRWRAHTWRVSGRARQLALFGGLAAFHVAAAWTAIWAHYDFRYSAGPVPVAPALLTAAPPQGRDVVPGFYVRLIHEMKRTRFLPEGFLIGIDQLLSSDQEMAAFKNGERKFGGWRGFFPYAIWVKTPPALFLLLLIGAVAVLAARPREPSRPGLISPAGPAYAATPCLALIACYLAVAISQDINIGHRHVLPIYPALHILAGTAVFAWDRRTVWMGAAALAALGWLVRESIAIRPHYLAYFGPQAGGAGEGYKHLVDSSLDWGMDLPGLKRWLDRHNPDQREPVFLSYFGNDNPEHYGIKAKRLPGFFDRRSAERFALTPGYYVISASTYQSVYSAAFGRWKPGFEQHYQMARSRGYCLDRTAPNSGRWSEHRFATSAEEWNERLDFYENLRFARLCAWLRHQGRPPHHVGHAMFIWKLDAAALDAALVGPPVEMVNRPAVYRKFRLFSMPSPPLAETQTSPR